MTNSFDVYLEDGSSLTAEYAGKFTSEVPGKPETQKWAIFWLDELGENRVSYGSKFGTRCEVMVHVENMAGTFEKREAM